MEVRIGHRARVLKLTEDVVIEATEIAVWDKGLEHILAFIGNAVLGTREPCKKVIFAMIFKIGIEVMTLSVIRFAISVDKDFSFAI